MFDSSPMAISFPGVRATAKTGKGIFCLRLAAALREVGCKIVDDPEKSDIQLHTIKLRCNAKGAKVLRLAGVNHAVTNTDNAASKKSLRRCDGVVYQSQHARLMCDRYLGTTTKPYSVIFNGDDPKRCRIIDPAPRLFQTTYIAFSRWRRFKRLPETIEAFLEAGVRDAGLLVVGDTSQSGIGNTQLRRYKKRKDIVFTGKLPQEAIAAHLRNCVASLHLSPYEGCPNSVVEALMAGVSVICTNIGGTPEIVSPAGGTVCQLDSKLDGGLVDLNHPPKIDVRIVSQAIREHRFAKPVAQDHIHIKHIATEYLKLFHRVLENR